MQNELLAQYTSQSLRADAVWLTMLASDARDGWNGTTMPDTRVMHFWDGKTEIGQWFAEQVEAIAELPGMVTIFMDPMQPGKIVLPL